MCNKPKRKHSKRIVWTRSNTVIVFCSGIINALFMSAMSFDMFYLLGRHEHPIFTFTLLVIIPSIIGIITLLSIPSYLRNARNMLIMFIVTSIGISIMTWLTIRGVTIVSVCGLCLISPFYFFLMSIITSIQKHGNKLYDREKNKNDSI